MKAFETPEEKRARRLAKKEAKERKKREKMGWGEEYMGYTNTDNPFGDNNLLGTFIWNKVSPGRRPARGPGGSLPSGVSSVRTRALEPRPPGPLRRSPKAGFRLQMLRGPRRQQLVLDEKLHTVPYPPVPPRACD